MAQSKRGKLVVYLRDAKARPSIECATMELREAAETAVAQHRPGESPVIIGNGLEIVGIDAIRAVLQTGTKAI